MHALFVEITHTSAGLKHMLFKKLYAE